METKSRFDIIDTIIKDTKQKHERHDEIGIISNAFVLLSHMSDLIKYEVDNEAIYRKKEAELLSSFDNTGKARTSSWAETNARASDEYKNYQKAMKFRDLLYEVVQLSKKVATATSKEFNAS